MKFFRSTSRIQATCGPINYTGGWVQMQKKKYW